MGSSVSGATPRCCGCCGGGRWPPCGPRSSRWRPRSWPGSYRRGSTSGRGSDGVDGLAEVLTTLQGAALPASALEADILPARVEGYQPSDLDTLLTAGEVVWVGAGSLGSDDGRVRLLWRDQVAALVPEPDDGLAADDPDDVTGDRPAGEVHQLRNLDEAAPDPSLFPSFDDDLRASMRRETELFVETIVRERRPLRELLTADFTFVDGRLARHYDLPGIAHDDDAPFRRVALPDDRPGGLLTQAGILTITSNPDRTSPVKRGKWVLDNLLADPPPPPPPEVGNLDETPEAVAAASLRERLLRHQQDPKCATCHTRMDALGFALEAFDPVGRQRSHDGEFPVEAVGELPDGRRVAGAGGLRELLAGEAKFVRCVVKKLLTYAVGRGLAPGDERVVDRIVAGLPADPTMVDVIAGVVESDPFLRQGRPPEEDR